MFQMGLLHSPKVGGAGAAENRMKNYIIIFLNNDELLTIILDVVY